MRLDGIHHITGVTGDGQRCVDFYAGVMGLAFSRRALDRAVPGAHHLWFGDGLGRPGSVLSFFELPGVRAGRAGAGVIHRVAWRMADADALEFWAERLSGAGIDVVRTERAGIDTLRFGDPERLEHELVVDTSGDEPLNARSATIPPEHALRGFDGVSAYGRARVASADLLAGRLGFATHDGDAYRVEGPHRRAGFAYDEAPARRALGGAGVVHHVAWTCEADELGAWRQRVIGLGARVTPVVGRGRFRSFYFREPSGVVFEIATRVPRLAVDSRREPLAADRRESLLTEAGRLL